MSDFIIVDNNMLSQLHSGRGAAGWDLLFKLGDRVVIPDIVAREALAPNSPYRAEFMAWRDLALDGDNPRLVQPNYTYADLNAQYGTNYGPGNTQNAGDAAIRYLVDSGDFSGQDFRLATSDGKLFNYFETNLGSKPYEGVYGVLGESLIEGKISASEYNTIVDGIKSSGAESSIPTRFRDLSFDANDVNVFAQGGGAPARPGFFEADQIAASANIRGIKNAIDVAKKLGAAGDVLEAALTFEKVSSQIQAGDIEGAEDTLASFTGGVAGGFGAIALVGTALIGTGVGAPLGAALLLGAGIVGGLAGDAAGQRLIDKLQELAGGGPLILDDLLDFFGDVGQGIGDFWGGISNLFQDSLQPPRDPLILDLGPTGITLLSMDEANVYFDMDNDGIKERTGWLTAEDGYLAIDENNNGIIDNVGELIGDPGQSGFEELATYDSNNDGNIDSADAIWSDLRIWRDLDGDGETDAGELQTLAANSVGSLSTNFTTVNFTVAENLVHEQGNYTTTGGTQRLMIDAWMITDSVNTLPGSSGPVSAAAAELPNIRGYGALANLHNAMTANAALLTLVDEFVDLGVRDFGEVDGRIADIMISWAGADGIDPASRGGLFDAQKLAVLEAITGTPWVLAGSNPPVTDPPSFSVSALEQAWEEIVVEFAVRFLAAGPLSEALGGVIYVPNSDTLLGLRPLEEYADALGDLASTRDPRDLIDYWAQAVRVLENIGASNGLTTSQINQAIDPVLTKFGLQDLPLTNPDQLYDLTDGPAVAEIFTTRGIYALPDFDNFVGISNYYSGLLGGRGDDYLFADTSSAVFLAGGAGSDVLIGGSGSDFLDGGLNGDWMEGGRGNDVYTVDNIADVVIERTGEGTDVVRSSIDYTLGDDLEELVLTGTADIDGTGNNGNNVLTGNSGQNVLSGLAGNDRYVIDGTDQVIEIANGGADTVESSDSYMLGAYVEELILTGTRDINGTGNELANRITGNDGDNVLDGRAGNDYLIGGAGNDLYIVDSTSDYVLEYADGGYDRVHASVNFTLGNNVEALLLTGADDIYGYGNTLENRIEGNSGNNTIDGRTGDDVMLGMAGDDTYFVDSAGDIVIEAANEGIDSVTVSIAAYTLSDNVENLTLNTSSSAPFTGTGNALNNEISGARGADSLSGLDGNDLLFGGTGSSADTLLGGAGDDTLDGGGGPDSMVGGTGNDVYVLDDANDLVIEEARGGLDTILTNTSIFSLAANIENIVLNTSGQFDINGNSSNNLIIGNASNNNIDGQGGADDMRGGAGNDTYTVDSSLDRITETLQNGSDSVRAFTDWALGSNLESLTLLGGTAIYARGNTLDNTLTGNALDNIIVGAGGGNDTMTGGAGADRFVVTEYDPSDETVIADFAIGLGGDTIDLTRLLEDVGYTGTDPFGDDVLRISTYSSTISAINYNTNWASPTGSPSWSRIVRVEGVTETELLGAIAQIDVTTGTANVGPQVVLADRAVFFDAGRPAQLDLSSGYVSDLDDLDLTWSVTAGLPGTMAFSGLAQRLFGLAPQSLDPATLSFSVSDGEADVSFDLDIWSVQTHLGEVLSEGASSGDDMTGTAGREILYGAGGHDLLEGLGGRDRLLGGTGDDTLAGGEGDDLLFGQTGNDEYRVTLADSGMDVINELGQSGLDRLVISDAGLADLDFRRSGTNLVIAGHDGITEVQITDAFISASRVEVLELLDGTYFLKDTLVGTGSNEIFVGTSGANTVNAAGGNDLIALGGGNDTAFGGTGNDRYLVNFSQGASDTVSEAGGGGSDTLAILDRSLSGLDFRRSGNTLVVEDTVSAARVAISGFYDTAFTRIETLDLTNGMWSLKSSLTGTATSDILVSGSSSDLVTGAAGDDLLIGGAGDDTLNAGTGDDTVFGGTGNDTYQFAATDGDLRLTEAGGTDRLMATGQAATDLEISRSGAALIVESTAGSARVVIGGQYSQATNRVEYLETTDGARILSLGLTGSGAAEVLVGASGDEVITGNAGADILTGAGGDDTLYGGLDSDLYQIDISTDGSDIISEVGGSGSDRLQITGTTWDDIDLRRSGNLLIVEDALSGERVMVEGAFGSAATRVEHLMVGTMDRIISAGLVGSGADEVLIGTSADEALSGRDGADYLVGGGGDDTLRGGTGNDTYQITFGTGADQDIISELGAGGTDTLRLIDTSLSDLDVRRSGTSLIIEDRMAEQRVLVSDFFGAATSRIETLDLDDGAFVLKTTTTGTATSDILVGASGDDVLTGNDGNDLLSGGGGKDRLYGGAGADVFDFGDVSESTIVSTQRDTIYDFEQGTDRIDVSGIDANAGMAGDNAFSFIGLGATTGAGTLSFAQVNGNTLIYADVDGNGADFSLLLAGEYTLTQADFVL